MTITLSVQCWDCSSTYLKFLGVSSLLGTLSFEDETLKGLTTAFTPF